MALDDPMLMMFSRTEKGTFGSTGPVTDLGSETYFILFLQNVGVVILKKQSRKHL